MRQLLKHSPFALISVAALACACPIAAAQDAPYDLVIREGKIVDGTGNPWCYGDLAVRGTKIVAMGRVPPRPAKREINARGLVVAPGFIDMHSHSDFTLLEDGNAQSKIRQGVTTEVLGEGSSAGPCRGKMKRGTRKWPTLAAYFDDVEKSGVSVNVASYVGLDNVWLCVMGDS